MRRRPLLALAAGVPTAGCLGFARVPGPSGDAVQSCGSPGSSPDPREVCPGRDTDRVVWSVGADRDAPVRMTAGRRRATLPIQGLRFTLHNDSGASTVINPYGWRLSRWTGKDWTPATDGVVNLPAMTLPSGRSYTWRLSATPGEPGGDPPDRGGTRKEIRLDGLPGGTYAFWTDARIELVGEGTAEAEDREVAAAAVVELRRSG